MINFDEIANILKIKINDQKYFLSALTHRSYLNENKAEKIEHNERLEFLGDAVLELVVTEYLYNNYSEPEGVLTNWRSALVNGKMLSEIAENLDLSQHLRTSRGESLVNSKSRQYLLANTFEAIIGAIYLDSGYETAKKFITDNLIIKLNQIIKGGLYLDAKSKLQEYTQEKHSITPKYQIITEEGPDHNKIFTSAVYLKDKEIGRGEGSSKQLSEISAAKNALEKIQEEA